ncbi:hypothetical protein FQN57_002664 [Myotisia sp. PD_48]|nr:hypothetical protein FQN57_002664 [Myotisia sp. PD_48]
MLGLRTPTLLKRSRSKKPKNTKDNITIKDKHDVEVPYYLTANLTGAVVEEVQCSRKENGLRHFTSLLRLSTTSTPTCLGHNKHIALPQQPSSHGSKISTKILKSAAAFSSLLKTPPTSLGALAQSETVPAGQANVSMTLEAVGPGKQITPPSPPTATTTTAATTTTLSPPVVTKSPAVSKSVKFPTLRPRKSATQVAQRLSSWSGNSLSVSPSSSSGSKTTPKDRQRTAAKQSTVSADSLLSSNTGDQDTIQDSKRRSSIFRRLSPGLAARVKLLDGSNKPVNDPIPNTVKVPIGKIPAEHIHSIDSQHQDRSIKVEKRGTKWSGGLSRLGKQEPVSNKGGTEAEEQEQEQQEEYEYYQFEAESVDELALLSSSIATLSSIDTTMSTIHGSQTTVTTPGTIHGTEIDTTRGQTDLERYLGESIQNEKDAILSQRMPPPPIPPPKDSPPTTFGGTATESYFNPLGLHRTESIYSFSRASFSSQLSQLTSISLPQPSTLEESISSIDTAPAAVRALTGAAEQIQRWITKASDVLGGLEAEDDVEWAAAGGREGLEDVDKAIRKFESLINVYVKAIEEVQLRDDISNVGPRQLNNIVIQMESTIKNWGTVGSLLQGVKEQVEFAMEWEELWNVVLGDVGLEVENLGRMIFEMEEKRHKAVTSDADNEPTGGLDINELETIVEESPANGNTPLKPSFNFTPIIPSSGPQFDLKSIPNPQTEPNLLALFARMQPLRASLDFLPMRLSMFQSRAQKIFPSACDELEDKRIRLEQGYKKLEADAEALRRELGEDRWVIVFRNAGKQAHKMCESVERSVSKLHEAIEGGIQHNNPAALAKRAENFEAKKIHYGSAIERVLSIIQKGIKERLTVNGEIIRLHTDLAARFDNMKEMACSMDSLLEELNAAKTQQLRDSVSSILTLDSRATRSAIDTPGSSPTSSVILSVNEMNGSSHLKDASRRSSAAGSSTSRGTATKYKRYSTLPQPNSSFGHTPRKPSIPRAASSTPKLRTTSASPTPYLPRPSSRMSGSSSTKSNKPQWNHFSNTNDLDTGHNFKPMSLTTPSPHRKLPIPTRTPRSTSSLGPRSPLSRESSASPAPGMRPSSRLNFGPVDRSAPLSPALRPSIIAPPPYSKLRKSSTPGNTAATTNNTTSSPTTPRTFSGLPTTPRARQSYTGNPSTRAVSGAAEPVSPVVKKTPNRPGTSLGHSSRRSSMLPLPKSRSGRDSIGNLGEKPQWR